jgi:cyclic pyranopterin phosphate synthase
LAPANGHTLTDPYGRTLDYLRLSVTDRCNLRCVYCMPAEGVEFVPHENILSYEEMIHIVRLMAARGLKKVKITGGEPLVRKHLASLVSRLTAIPGITKVTLTTNGTLLRDQLPDLVAAGLDGVNISLDTLDPGTHAALTRGGKLRDVLDSIESALRYARKGQLTVKLNCVPIKASGVANSSILDLAALARENPLHVRFIELMPIGLGKGLPSYSDGEIRAILENAFGPMTFSSVKLGNGPAVYYSLPGFTGKIGFISALSHEFCDSCNRLRLTSEGFLKTCLQYGDGVDLRSALRGAGAKPYAAHHFSSPLAPVASCALDTFSPIEALTEAIKAHEDAHGNPDDTLSPGSGGHSGIEDDPATDAALLVLIDSAIARKPLHHRFKEAIAAAHTPDKQTAPDGAPLQPPGSSALAPGSPALVPGSSAQIPGSSAQVPDSPAPAPGSPALVPGSSAQIPGSSAQVPDSSAQVPDSPALVPGSSEQIPGSPAQVPSSSLSNLESKKMHSIGG